MAHTFRGIMSDLKGGKGWVVKGRVFEGSVREEGGDGEKKAMRDIVGENEDN